MLVADIMTKNVQTVTQEHTLSDICKIFENAPYRHLLVEENKKLVGVLSDRDVLEYSSPFLQTVTERSIDRAQQQLPAKNFMSAPPITVDMGTLIDCASILLLENNISCLPVVDEDMTINGIVSWKDILQYAVYGIDKNINEYNLIARQP